MKNPRLTKVEIGDVIRFGEAQKVASEAAWGADVSRNEKVNFIKQFLVANGVRGSLVNRTHEIADLREVLNEIDAEPLIDAAIDQLNDVKYRYIRMQLGIVIGRSRRDVARFNKLADKILEYGTDKTWPNHMMSAQRSLSSHLASLAPLNDETIFQRYCSLCLDHPTGISNSELIFKLHRFRRYRPQVEELCERLLSMGNLAVLHAISSCSFVRFTPVLEAKMRAIEESGKEDFVTRGTYSHLKSVVSKLRKVIV